ncbi:c-type cytochrome [Oceaniglobus ichthyenteri]|uniref:c-type cytochrome n=1 Tax=Oceaniglobus ichthyenteri TaxID=2136177 RepID=UPI000D37950D|nr:cytochrome c [Oceaniglobus ichthyenteri]
MLGFTKAMVLAICVATPAMAQDMAEGEQLFQHRCATCHGLSANGTGPMAPVLLIQPTDLTQLQQKNDGTFPVQRVVWRIDGREPLVSHGSPMPVYGDFFQGRDVTLKADTGQPIMTSQPIADLVAWLQSIQQ